MRLPAIIPDSLQSNELEASYVVHIQPTGPSEPAPGERSLEQPDEAAGMWAAEQRHWKVQYRDRPLPGNHVADETSTIKVELPRELPKPSSLEGANITRTGWIPAIVRCMAGVFPYILRMLRRAVILAVWLTSFALVWLILSAAFQVPRLPQSAMTSFCETDIISRTYLCGKPIVGRSTTTVGPERAQWADFPTLMMVQSAIAETFAGDIPVASDLALQITKAELATSDLIAAVRYSTLTTAEHLADSLTAFVRDAVVVGDSLQDLDAKAMGAIDSIIGINVWALQTIEHAKSANSGAMSSLAAWWTKKTTKEVINENFNEAMTAQSTILFHLIVLAEHSQGKLKRMKEQLQAIRDSARKENIHLTREEGELLASIWPKVGSKRRDLDRFATNLELLANLERYTDVAKLHIAQALLNLKAMQSQMKDLRSKVSQPEIAGTSIPVDVHIRTIMDGIHRMKEGRIRAREREGDIRTMGA